MKRPLAAIVVCYSAGLLLAEHFPAPLIPLFSATFIVLALALAFSKLRPALIWPLVALTGWANLTARSTVVSPNDLRLLLGSETRLASVRGTILERPDVKIYDRDGDQVEHTLVHLRVAELRQDNVWKRAYGSIVVTAPAILPEDFFAGQRIEVFGVLAPPQLPAAEGLFDYRTYLQHKGIYYQLKTASLADWKRLSTNSIPPWSDRFLAWAQGTLARGLPAQDEPLKLLWAMTLGWKTALTGEISAPFMQSGTMHIFAISGLHIALIAGILVAILRAVQLPRLWCGLVVVPLLWSYTAATGWQPSAIRSTIMMTIVIAGWSLKRPGNLLNSLAAAAFIILLYDPRQLFQASFQLSFFVVLSIALIMPPLEKLRDRLLHHDPLLPPGLIPRWKRMATSGLRVVTTWLATSFAAWLGSWPLTAHYFHLFSPVTLLANLLIVPLASAALACNVGSLICGGWLPWVGDLFNFSGWLWMKWMLEISHAVIRLPGAYFYVSGPQPVDFVIYYGAMLAILSGAAFRGQWRWVTASCIGGIVLFSGWRWHEARQQNLLTVLPLNGGHAIFFQSGRPGGNLLVNCGNTNSVEFVTRPFLHAHGVNRLPRLALTHGDIRSMGGALQLCDEFSVGKIATSPARFRSAVYRQTLQTLDQTPAGTKWSKAATVLAPGACCIHPSPTALPRPVINHSCCWGRCAG